VQLIVFVKSESRNFRVNVYIAEEATVVSYP